MPRNSILNNSKFILSGGFWNRLNLSVGHSDFCSSLDLLLVIILVLRYLATIHVHIAHGVIQALHTIGGDLWSSINCLFEFSISLLLYGLSVLQLLNHFHLQHFHLHHFSFLLSDGLLFFHNLSFNIKSSSFMFLSPELFDLSTLNSFLLFLHPVFHLIFLGLLRKVLMMALFVLLSDEFSLFCLFLFMQDDGISDLFLFVFPVSLLSQDLFSSCLINMMILLHLGHFCMSFLFIVDLQFSYFLSSFLGLLDFLPGFEFLLFKESNSICE